jgi:hypothetical protein
MPIPFWHPGTIELIDNLSKYGIEVVALDLWELRYFDHQKTTHDLIPKVFSGFFAKVYRRLFRNYVIRKYIKQGDIVDIQWCGHYYAKYMTNIKKRRVKIVATLFGSDLYRSTNEQKRVQKRIFEVADKIVMGVNMVQEFEKHFPGHDKKINFAQYGSSRLTLVKEINNTQSRIVLREKYGISEKKIVVTVGYNAKPEQQHTLFLRQIEKTPKHIKEKLFLIFPLTYGAKDNGAYFEELNKMIDNIGIENYRICHRISDVEMAETKVISDITVNMQTTDALSSSIKEAFVAGDVLLVGDWLPYDVYNEIGAYFFRSNTANFGPIFLDIVQNYELHSQKCKQNSQIIMNFASWDAVMPQFLKNYYQLWQE